MSYKQAWDLVNQMNEGFDAPVVESHRGGKGGGNAVVTEKGKLVIRRYQALRDQFNQFLETLQDQIDL